MFITYKRFEKGKPWEETPEFGTLNMSSLKAAEEGAELIANISKVEVRWNEAGSAQGHYVSPPLT